MADLGNKKNHLFSHVKLTEQEGFEPPLPCGKTVFKTVDAKPQLLKQQVLTASQKGCVQTNSKNALKQGKLPADLTEIVTAWPELPGYIKAAIRALIKTV